MSEDERPDDQGGDQNDEPTGEQAGDAASPDDAAPENASPDAEASGSAPEPAAGDQAGPDEPIDDEAGAAVQAAQDAVAQAMDGDLDDATGADEAAVGAAKSDAAGMDQLASAAAGGRAFGAGLPSDEAPAPVDLPSFDRSSPEAATAEMRLLGDVNVDVRIELGRTRMLVEDVLRLNAGAVVELEKLAGDPVDVYVNGRHVAKGEVLVLNENFCIRVNEVLEAGPANKRG